MGDETKKVEIRKRTPQEMLQYVVDTHVMTVETEHLLRMIVNQHVAQERERCAKVAEAALDPTEGARIADSIREGK